MHNNTGIGGPERLAQGFDILKHPLGAGEIGVLQQDLMAPLFQRDIVVVRHAVIAGDTKTLVQQKLGQVEADKSGSACDEDGAHKVSDQKTAVVPPFSMITRQGSILVTATRSARAVRWRY